VKPVVPANLSSKQSSKSSEFQKGTDIYTAPRSQLFRTILKCL